VRRKRARSLRPRLIRAVEIRTILPDAGQTHSLPAGTPFYARHWRLRIHRVRKLGRWSGHRYYPRQFRRKPAAILYHIRRRRIRRRPGGILCHIHLGVQKCCTRHVRMWCSSVHTRYPHQIPHRCVGQSRMCCSNHLRVVSACSVQIQYLLSAHRIHCVHKSCRSQTSSNHTSLVLHPHHMRCSTRCSDVDHC
jgi:hypothetical protein